MKYKKRLNETEREKYAPSCLSAFANDDAILFMVPFWHKQQGKLLVQSR